MWRILIACILSLFAVAADSRSQGPLWTASFTSGSTVGGHFLGGTEGRAFAALNVGLNSAKLFFGNSYWNDTWGGEGKQNAQVLVMTTPNGTWSQDVSWGSFCPADNPVCALATSALQTLDWQYDAAGTPVTVTTLVASTWWEGTSTTVGCGTTPVYSFVRNNSDSLWYPTQVVCDVSSEGVAQIRSFGIHTDQVITTPNIVQYAFAGEGPTGIWHGTLSTTRGAGHNLINWTTGLGNEEWFSGNMPNTPSCTRQARIQGFAEATGADGKLREYMTVCWFVYVRIDGPQSTASPALTCNSDQVVVSGACVQRWQLYWTNPNGTNASSQSGSRGLTTVRTGGNDVLVIGAEGSAPMDYWQITPYPACATPTDQTCYSIDYPVLAKTADATGMKMGNMVGAYNNFRLVYDENGNGHRLVTQSNYITAATTTPPPDSGFTFLALSNGGKKWAEGCYAFRSSGGTAHYNLQCIPQLFPTAMNGTRDIISSPWPTECNNNRPPGNNNIPGYNCAFYATGFDDDGATGMYWCQTPPCPGSPSFVPVHNTAWIARLGLPLP